MELDEKDSTEMGGTRGCWWVRGTDVSSDAETEEEEEVEPEEVVEGVVVEESNRLLLV